MIALLWLLAPACEVLEPTSGTEDSGSTSTLPEGPALDATTEEGRSNSNGRVRVEIEVTPDIAAFQVTAEADYYPSLDELIDPSGETVLRWQDWVGTDRSLTQAFYISQPTIAFDWPVREIDGPLEPGTWVAWFALTDQLGRGLANERITTTVTRKHDPDPTAATVGVQIVWADGVEEEPGVADAIDGAVERWRRIWADQGVTLAEHYTNSTIEPNIDFVFVGDDKVENVAGRKEPGELQLIIGESVFNDPYILGISAGIPGSVEATPFTFVVLSWLNHAGRDGAFDQEEIRIMGETMAHEIGHYTGLFHPVETTYADWDALDDTPECSSAVRCDDELGRNLMYPYPVCNLQSCQAQGQLTGDQSGVIHGYVGAL